MGSCVGWLVSSPWSYSGSFRRLGLLRTKVNGGTHPWMNCLVLSCSVFTLPPVHHMRSHFDLPHALITSSHITMHSPRSHRTKASWTETLKPWAKANPSPLNLFSLFFVTERNSLTWMATYWSLWSSHTSGSLLDGEHNWWVTVMGVFINSHWMCLLLEAKKKPEPYYLVASEGTSVVPEPLKQLSPEQMLWDWVKLGWTVSYLGGYDPVFTIPSAMWRWWGRGCGSQSTILQWWHSLSFLGIVCSYTCRCLMLTWSFLGTTSCIWPNTP